jgi:hypothetical protein
VIQQVLMAVLMSVLTFAGTLLLLAALFRAQIRRYNRVVATDLLDEWTMRLRLLDAAERERAMQSPSPAVVAAMVSLPAAGVLTGWAEQPVSSLDGQ